MRTISSALRAFLSASNKFYSCDLYDLRLMTGETYRYADYDMNITANGRFYSCSPAPLFKRGSIKKSAAIEVDKCTVTWNIDENDTVAGLPILKASHAGTLDHGELEILRCFMSSPGVVVGTISRFDGEIYVKSGGGLALKLDVKSAAQRFKDTFPRNRYYPTCPWTLYGAGCGLVQGSWVANGTVTGGALLQVQTSLSFPSGYYDYGVIQWMTGLNAGSYSSIKTSSPGYLNLLVQPEAAFQSGDTFRVYPGCDKTVAMCRDKFHNTARNRATPFVPLKETLL